MANEVVKYKNDMNLVPMRHFTAVEMDLFFAICAKMKKRKSETVRFTFNQLRSLSNYKPTSTKRFADDLDKTYDKMLHLTYGKTKDGVRSRFVLFTGFEIDENEKFVDISVNPKLEHILNELDGTFTRFELAAFTSLRGSYAKTMYRLLCQFKVPGYYIVKIDDFKHLLGIPENYSMGKIDERILIPIKNELTPFYEYLDINKKKKAGRGRGGVVTHFEFHFREKEEINVPIDFD